MEKITRYAMVTAALALVFAAGVAWSSRPVTKPQIGFFAPSGLSSEFAGKVQFAVVNAGSIQQLRTNLQLARNTGTSLYVAIGPLIARPATASEVSGTYTAQDGTTKHKSYEPVSNIKIRRLHDDATISQLFSPYATLLGSYQDVLKGIDLVDEPYLNGVSRPEIERVAKVTRRLMTDAGIKSPRIGINFAAAEFDPGFAAQIAGAANRYVNDVEAYRSSILNTPTFPPWDAAFRAARLTTYDSAGSLYAEGGIPAGLDFVSFDFYVSTLLMDALDDQALAWFADNVPDAPCGAYRGTTMGEIRRRLSFFHDGPVEADPSIQDADKVLLDSLFACRMKATVSLLRKAVAKSDTHLDILLIGESSSNGFMEFDARGNIEPDQPEKLVELRALQETRRYLDYYNSERSQFAGISFFIFNDEYDKSINLNIRGARGMPSVAAAIFGAAR